MKSFLRSICGRWAHLGTCVAKIDPNRQRLRIKHVGFSGELGYLLLKSVCLNFVDFEANGPRRPLVLLVYLSYHPVPLEVVDQRGVLKVFLVSQ